MKQRHWILLVSTAICVILFLLLLNVFKGVANHLANRLKPEYITPTAKDSLYTNLLQDSLTREQTVEIGKQVRNFYILSDSVMVILGVPLSDELKSGILLEKGLADELRLELVKLDSASFPCEPSCLDVSLREQEEWIALFNMPAKDLKSYIKALRIKISKAEYKALSLVK